MNALPNQPAANVNHLAAALAWLRLRLGTYRDAPHPPSAPGSAPKPAPKPNRSWPGPVCPAKLDPAAAKATLDPLIGHSAVPPTVSDRYAGLNRHSGLDRRAGLAAAETTMRAAEAATPPPALVRLGDLLGLSAFERDVLLLCAAMELDPDTGVRCAEAVNDPRLACPTFALALAALPDPAWDAMSPHRGLRRWRLVEITQPAGAPLVTSPLRADERIVNYLRGLNELDDRLEPLLTPIPVAGTGLPPSQSDAVRAIGQTQSSTPAVLVQLVGPDPLSKQLVAAAAAGAAGLELYRLPAAALPHQAGDLETVARLWSREAILLGAALYVDAEQDGDASLVTRFLGRTEGMRFLAVREPWQGLDGASVVDVGRPSRTEQRTAWADVLDPATPAAVPDSLAGQFDLNLPTITGIAQTVPTAPANGYGERLWDACLADTRPRLDALAQRLEPKATWADLVLPEAELALLHQLADQVAQRATVYEKWGFTARMSRGLGISALFTGPSGTGKTLAAEVIANHLRLNLYRIDLSAVVSKYIGETEKNLRRLFDAAEEGAALLFFDEADALFGKRSEVKDSHDRYANIEINYLLQRMESYTGLAILATNMRSALDPAFQRRLRFTVSFAPPGPAERRQIWTRIFPASVPTGDLDLDRLAGLPTTGGMIANIALNASFAAAHAGGAVTMPLVLTAARTEFRKLDLPVRDRDFNWTPEARVST